jgi:type IV pilus assembly protein PilB
MERLRDLIGYLKDAADLAEERIEAALEEYGEAKPSTQIRVNRVNDGFFDRNHDDLLKHDASTMAESVAAVEAVIVEALAARASDVHFENELDEVRIRIRVDGDLRILPGHEIDKAQLDRMVRVIKVKSGIDISEHRVAKGGRFETVVGGEVWYVRVQTQPTVRGENVIMRLLAEDAELQTLSRLGFSESAEFRYRRLLSNPGGLILVVGPTGSGKTTTLYAGLKELAVDETRKVISIEDPVEFGCEGVQQVQVAREAGFGYADAMRAFVRQDPDVILLGEIRDAESALEAIRASQTGHLVLSTLHCNDAVDAVQRLLDLGMQANSISSELLAVFAQRLAKRICESCREPTEPDAEVAAEVFPDGIPEGFVCYRGRGCGDCDQSGYFGRIAVVEHLPMNPRLRNVIAHGSTLEDLRKVARESGIISLRDRSLELVQQGIIAFESLPRFIPIDRLG